MARRIDIEVTSLRPDGSFTWRQAGAKAPRGAGAAGLLPDGSKIGDVLRADIETDMDGAVVLAIAPIAEKKRNVTLITVTGSGAEFKPVTEISTSKRNKPPREKRDRTGDRRGSRNGDRRGAARDAGAPARPARREFTPPPPELPKRPRATRLRPGVVHRNAALEALTAAERVLAEKALEGGVGAVRKAVNEQNKQLKKDGKPAVNSDALVNMVLELLPRLRVAEWKDSVEAVEKIIDTVDLRDLRAVVAKSNDPTLMKDASLNEKRDALRAALDRRQNEEMQHWQDDLRRAVEVGRIVAALKLAAQPPKAGTLVPADLRPRLVAQALEQLTPLSPSDRWVVVLEALAFSPIHNEVVPVAAPAKSTPELTATVTRLAPLLPKIAALFGVVVDPQARAPRPLRPEWRDRKKKKGFASRQPREKKPAAQAGAAATADN
jgi:FtsZ-binding cell division protein ZapB